MEKYAQKNIKAISFFMHFCRRTPPGVRGLKFRYGFPTRTPAWSHPTRGAWIEILVDFDRVNVVLSRTPPGVRGLKSTISVICAGDAMSHPTRGAWIEISIE